MGTPLPEHGEVGELFEHAVGLCQIWYEGHLATGMPEPEARVKALAEMDAIFIEYQGNLAHILEDIVRRGGAGATALRSTVVSHLETALLASYLPNRQVQPA